MRLNFQVLKPVSTLKGNLGIILSENCIELPYIIMIILKTDILYCTVKNLFTNIL